MVLKCAFMCDDMCRSTEHQPLIGTGSGTTISVRDLFFSVPVRRKLIDPQRDAEQLKARIERIALMYSGVHFTLYQTKSVPAGSVTVGSGRTGSSTASVVLLECRRTTGLKQSFAGLVSPHLASLLHAIGPVSSKSSTPAVAGGGGGGGSAPVISAGWQLDGLCCGPAVSSPSRLYQFVYVNRRPVYHRSIHAYVDTTFKRINSLLTSGSIGSAAAGGGGTFIRGMKSAKSRPPSPTPATATAAGAAGVAATATSTTTSRGGIAVGAPARSYAVFVFNFTCSDARAYDIAYDPNKVSIEFSSLSTVLGLVEDALKQLITSLYPALGAVLAPAFVRDSELTATSRTTPALTADIPADSTAAGGVSGGGGGSDDTKQQQQRTDRLKSFEFFFAGGGRPVAAASPSPPPPPPPPAPKPKAKRRDPYTKRRKRKRTTAAVKPAATSAADTSIDEDESTDSIISADTDDSDDARAPASDPKKLRPTISGADQTQTQRSQDWNFSVDVDPPQTRTATVAAPSPKSTPKSLQPAVSRSVSHFLKRHAPPAPGPAPPSASALQIANAGPDRRRTRSDFLVPVIGSDSATAAASESLRVSDESPTRQTDSCIQPTVSPARPPDSTAYDFSVDIDASPAIIAPKQEVVSPVTPEMDSGHLIAELESWQRHNPPTAHNHDHLPSVRGKCSCCDDSINRFTAPTATRIQKSVLPSSAAAASITTTATGADGSTDDPSSQASRTQTISKAMISRMQAIGQVDNKYLLVVADRTLIALDQHAADERRKLEM